MEEKGPRRGRESEREGENLREREIRERGRKRNLEKRNESHSVL